MSTTLERVASTLGPGFYIGPPRAPATARARRGYEGRAVRERPAAGDDAAPAWATKLQRELRAGLREDLARALGDHADATRDTVTRDREPVACSPGSAE